MSWEKSFQTVRDLSVHIVCVHGMRADRLGASEPFRDGLCRYILELSWEAGARPEFHREVSSVALFAERVLSRSFRLENRGRVAGEQAPRRALRVSPASAQGGAESLTEPQRSPTDLLRRWASAKSSTGVLGPAEASHCFQRSERRPDLLGSKTAGSEVGSAARYCRECL